MRTTTVTIWAMTILLMVGCSQAKQLKMEQVEQRVESLRLAMIDPTREKLEDLTSEKLSYGHSSGKLEDRAAFIETLLSGRSNFESIDLKEQTIVIENETAIVRHLLEAKTLDNGEPGEVKLRILLVFSHMSGEWRLLARQAVKAL